MQEEYKIEIFFNGGQTFGTITTVCDDLVEEYCSKTNDGFELYDRHFWNDDTLECQIVNVGKLKSRADKEE